MTLPGASLPRLCLRLVLALALLAPLAAAAQDVLRQVDESGALLPQAALPAAAAGEDTLDYASWTRMAERAETLIENRNAAAQALDLLRGQLVDWREALLGAQNANAARIATLRTQISALGPVPPDGTSEAPEIALRRSELTEQLVRLQAPGIAAEEAYRRADGLIREIDRVNRERQADALLQWWPAPLNPGNWPEALIGLTDTGVRLWDETAEQWGDRRARQEFGDKAPLILVLLIAAWVLIMHARPLVEKLADRLIGAASARGRQVWGLFASLGAIVFPLGGAVLLMGALKRTQMLGETGLIVVDALPQIALPAIVGAWAAARVFPRGAVAGPLRLSSERRAEGRYLAVALGLLLGVERLRAAAMDAQSYSDATSAVMGFPGLALTGLLLFRVGQLLRRHVHSELRGAEAVNYGTRIMGLVAPAVMALGVLAPLLAAVGYVAAAKALAYPAVLSLGLIGLLLILQDLVSDLYGLLLRQPEGQDGGLAPVLINFALAIVSLPVFALIWGARAADLTELWTRFREGFTLGETQISPTDFLLFAVIFGLIYTLTRLFQGALKTSILPRTGLDQGGQNAVVSGVGYVGIFLAALIGINATGIDLSGLAIVAGALSVGIGFGLQTVVSNFVSGIILLIERPVSEGDWIEVGPVQGIVKAISVRSTRIQTFDRSDVIVPNSDLISGRVTNWTRFNLTGRLIVPVAVPLTEDSRRIERILREIAEAQPMVILNPPPQVALMGFTGEQMMFEIRVILRDVNFILQVRSEINHEIARRFAEEGVDFTNAHRDWRAKKAEEAAAALEDADLAAALGEVLPAAEKGAT